MAPTSEIIGIPGGSTAVSRLIAEKTQVND
jgi:hypothetical protein